MPMSDEKYSRTRDERDEWRNALQSLTPQGSEYQTPDACVAHVRDDRARAWDRFKRAKRRLDEAERETEEVTYRCSLSEHALRLSRDRCASLEAALRETRGRLNFAVHEFREAVSGVCDAFDDYAKGRGLPPHRSSAWARGALERHPYPIAPEPLLGPSPEGSPPSWLNMEDADHDANRILDDPESREDHLNLARCFRYLRGDREPPEGIDSPEGSPSHAFIENPAGSCSRCGKREWDPAHEVSEPPEGTGSPEGSPEVCSHPLCDAAAFGMCEFHRALMSGEPPEGTETEGRETFTVTRARDRHDRLAETGDPTRDRDRGAKLFGVNAATGESLAPSPLHGETEDEARERRGRFSLNAFHAANVARQHEAFAPAHPLMALVACVQEEVGELAGAVLGVTGEKARKAHKTREDVLDAVADAMTYLSLVAGAMDCDDLERLLADTFNMVSKRAGSSIFVPTDALSTRTTPDPDAWSTHHELRDLLTTIPDDSDRIRAFRLLNETLSPGATLTEDQRRDLRDALGGVAKRLRDLDYVAPELWPERTAEIAEITDAILSTLGGDR